MAGTSKRVVAAMVDLRGAVASVGALVRAVPVLGGALLLGATVAGLLALGVLVAIARLATAGGVRAAMLAAIVLAVLMFAEVAAHALARLLATVGDRRLAAALRARVMAVTLLPTTTGHYDEPALDTARGIGIRREPKPGAALPGITGWWITTVRRGGAFALLSTAAWWAPPVAMLAWLAVPAGSARRGAAAAIGPTVAIGALTAVLVTVAGDTSVSPGWRLVQLQAVFALAADPGTTLTRIRQLLSSGVALAAAARALPNTPANHISSSTPPPAPPHEIRFAAVNLTVPAGGITALAGPAPATGELVGQLTRLRAPDDGTVLVNDIPLCGIDVTAWWRGLAYVPAHPIRLPSTLAANVALATGSPNQRLPAELRQALAAAGLGDLADGLPSGERTLLTADLRDGVDLGAAEWHRIALARALVRILTGGARLLIVAEAGAEALRVARHAQRVVPALTTVLCVAEPSMLTGDERLIELAATSPAGLATNPVWEGE